MTISTLPVNHNSILPDNPGAQAAIASNLVEQGITQSMNAGLPNQMPVSPRGVRMPGAFGLPNSPYTPVGLAAHHPNNTSDNLVSPSENGLYSMPNYSVPNMHSNIETDMTLPSTQHLSPHSAIQPFSPSLRQTNRPQIAHHHSLSMHQYPSSQLHNNDQLIYPGRPHGYHHRQNSQPVMMHQSHSASSLNAPYGYYKGSTMMGSSASSQTFGLMHDANYRSNNSMFDGRNNTGDPSVSITHEALANFRKEVMSSHDPSKSLDFAKYLLKASQVLPGKESDPKKAQRMHNDMVLEAQRMVKKLAGHSGIGKQAYAEAQFFLANSYGTGTMGLPTDTEKAFSFYFQGSKQNHPGCTYRTGVCYEVGAGTKRDKNHAMQFYRKAANLGDQAAMYKLGVILLKGFLGQPKNPREGISWLRRAAQKADADHPHALHELGLAFEKEGIPSILPDLNYARELFTQAAQYGFAPSQFKLGLAYENGFLNCPVDPRRSIAWYSKAAQQGDIEAEFALSGWYLTGAEGILRQSDKEAYLWARRAADKGNAKAEYAVGYYTETGTGTRQDVEEAKRWYMRASAQNYARATQRLTELKHNSTTPRQRKKHTRESNTSSNTKDSECIVM